MQNKISYFESNGKYLIMKEDGSSDLLDSKTEFNKYLTDNKCDLIT